MKNIISWVGKCVNALTNTIPTKIVGKIGHDKLAHGLLTAYVVCLSEHFGLIGAVIAFALMVGLGYLREKNEELPDMNDARWMVYFGAAELLRFLIFG